VEEIKDKYFLLAVACLLIASCSNYKKIRIESGAVKVRKDDLAEVKHFLTFNFHQFKGKTVEELIKGIDRKYLSQNFDEEPILVANHLITHYPNNISVKVYINERFMLHWLDDSTNNDLDSFNSKKLKGIKLFYKDKWIDWLEDY
jgi:hypothetical protein